MSFAPRQPVPPDDPEPREPAAPRGAPDEDYDALIQGDAPGFIGVPDSMMQFDPQTGEWKPTPWQAPVVQETYRDHFMRQTGTRAPMEHKMVDPKYFSGQEKQPALFGIQTTEDILRVQLMMEQAGILEPGSYTPGAWDSATWGASDSSGFRSVLAFSNVTGRDWRRSLSFLRSQHLAGADTQAMREGAGQFMPDPYMAPDYASLSQQVKQMIRGRLGRDPEDYEVALLADQMAREHRRAHDVQQQAARQQHDMRARATEGEEPGDPGTFTQVDPQARMMEQFDKQYGPELNRLDRVSDANEARQNLLGSIAGIRQEVGV